MYRAVIRTSLETFVNCTASGEELQIERGASWQALWAGRRITVSGVVSSEHLELALVSRQKTFRRFGDRSRRNVFEKEHF
jgi:hypothetical protein